MTTPRSIKFDNLYMSAWYGLKSKTYRGIICILDFLIEIFGSNLKHSRFATIQSLSRTGRGQQEPSNRNDRDCSMHSNSTRASGLWNKKVMVSMRHIASFEKM